MPQKIMVDEIKMGVTERRRGQYKTRSLFRNRWVTFSGPLPNQFGMCTYVYMLCSMELEKWWVVLLDTGLRHNQLTLQILSVKTKTGRLVINDLSETSTFGHLQSVLKQKTSISPPYQKSKFMKLISYTLLYPHSTVWLPPQTDIFVRYECYPPVPGHTKWGDTHPREPWQRYVHTHWERSKWQHCIWK